MKWNRRAAVCKRAVSSFLAVWMVVMTLGTAASYAASDNKSDTGAGVSAAPGGSFTLGDGVAAAILIDAATGQVLYEQNADQPRPPASMTKMMTEYIVLEKIKNKQLTWDTMVTTSKEAASTPVDGSQIYLAEGDQHSVEDLYIAMAVGSANDATIALASHIAGSEAGFVDLMNETAATLGLKTARFTGATGLQADTIITARDTAKLAEIILREDPDFLKYSSIPSYKFRPRDTKPMINWNWMLESNKDVTNFKQFAYEGVDGMKTGYIAESGYNFTGTAERNGMRLISVVMGAKTMQSRFFETAKLFDYGFNNFESKTIVAPKSVVENVKTVKISKGAKTNVAVVTETDVTFLVRKGGESKVEVLETKVKPADELVAPIPAGEPVGTVTYAYTDGSGKQLQKTVNLVTSEEAKKGSWWRLMFRGVRNFFAGLFSGIVDLF
nr:D-alanyl-D-alanine carboxypeptidase family protein [Paenibacillus darwinianus]